MFADVIETKFEKENFEIDIYRKFYFDYNIRI